MDDKKIYLLALMAACLIIFAIVVSVLDSRGINSIKSKAVGDGQHGTARWATKPEIRQTFISQPYEPDLWRQGKNLPKVQGTVIGCQGKVNTTALVDTGDVHSLMIGAAGVGKTAYFLYPNIEFCLASGMSFLSTDTKGDIARNYGNIAKNCYGYNVSVLQDKINDLHETTTEATAEGTTGG